jgi:hypothetical protein
MYVTCVWGYNDIIGLAKGSQISEKYWGEVGKGKRVDVYLEVRKRRGHIFFEVGEHGLVKIGLENLQKKTSSCL